MVRVWKDGRGWKEGGWGKGSRYWVSTLFVFHYWLVYTQTSQYPDGSLKPVLQLYSTVQGTARGVLPEYLKCC